MNRDLVESILTVIKTSSDKGVVVKGLFKLRTDLVKDRDGILLFREAGGVAPMVRFLNKPHEQILEIALSILGNCCTNEACCKEALDCKVSVSLATILKSIPNPIIQCRACRLLGNLAKCDVGLLLATHCPAMAQSVCQIIEETTDVQTRMMAFRACRFLLANPQFLKHFVINNGFVILLRLFAGVMKNDAVVPELEPLPNAGDGSPPFMGGLKKNQHREKYFEEVARNLEGVRSDIFDHEVLKNSPRTSNAYAIPREKAALDLAYEILKCLLVMSEMQMNYTVWCSLNRSDCTFAPIVFFAAEENKHRSGALKILSNFSKNQGAFYILSSADAIVAACELLVAEHMEKTLTESEVRQCINVITMLSSDACNRSKIRRSGAIRKLISMIRDSNSQTEISSILYILNNFQYDNMSLDLMLKDGLIPVLIKELSVYLSSDDEYHKKKREEKQQTGKKRKLPDQASESLSKVVKIREEPANDCDESPSSSPRSYISPSSPCSSRSLSPVGSNLFKLNEETGSDDDETYSPICSECSDDEGDNDGEDAPLANNEAAYITDNSDIMKLLDIACRTEALEDNMLDKEDDDEISQDVIAPKLPQLGNLPPSSIDIIENLLFRATLQVNKRSELGKPETMNTLIKAINIFGANNNFAGSLTTILLESQFFANAVKQGIPHQLFQLTKTEEMRRDGLAFLETLTNVGESNYGKAELARLLRSGDDVTAQNRAAIAVAYIIRSQRVLFQFLNDGSALAQLLNVILRGKHDECTAEAVDALTFMCRHTLAISVPQIDAVKREYEEFVEEDDKAELHQIGDDMRFLVYERGDSAEQQTKAAAAPVVIAFNKQLLCDSSEVFNTMLNSDFREGHEGEIHLRSYTPSGLRYFLNLIVRQSQQLAMTVPPPHKYHALLEAFEMSRIYIMPTMEQFLLKMLIGLLDESNCLSVLEWALKNYHAELTEMAINYYLCSTLSTEAKVQLFRSADYSTYSAEWFQMIFDAVFVRCRNGF